MKKYAVILSCMALSCTLSFAQNDPTASDADKAHPPIDSATSSDTSIDAAGQSATSEQIVAEPAGAGQLKEVGTITLQGTVKTAEEKQAIEDHLKSMPGVSKVENKLTIIGEISDPAGAQTEEEALEAEDDDADDDAEDATDDSDTAPDAATDTSSQNP